VEPSESVSCWFHLRSIRNALRSVTASVGFPGIVDVRDGRILSTLKKYEDAIQLNLQEWAMEHFGLRLRIENDARIALLGEQHAGLPKACGM
jgi:predicted NBD/HSP70 family sugar kinase